MNQSSVHRDDFSFRSLDGFWESTGANNTFLLWGVEEGAPALY